MRTFNLPKKFEVVPDGFGDFQAFELNRMPWGRAGGAIISVNYSESSCSPLAPEEWIANIKEAAIAAHKRGETSITVE